jgi:hypothetical protein
MQDPHYQLITPPDKPDYEELVSGLASASWPEFMLHDQIADKLWPDGNPGPA